MRITQSGYKWGVAFCRACTGVVQGSSYELGVVHEYE